MSPIAGPLHALALALALAGVAKAARPAGTAAALRVLSLPARRWWARVLGVVEVAVAAWALTGGGRPAAGALLVAHLGFGAAALLLRSRAATCGCFGDGSAPVTSAHLATNAVAVVVAGVAVADPVGSIGATAGALGGAAVAYLALVALLAWFEVLALTALAEVQGAAATLRTAT